MTNVSYEGKQVLYSYITDAIQPDSPGLDTGKLVQDARISNTDLLATLVTVCEAFEQPVPSASPDDRQQLVAALSQMLDTELSRPAALSARGENVVLKSQPLEDNPVDGLHVHNGRISRQIVGSTTHTQRVLRNLRHNAGWQAFFVVSASHNKTVSQQALAAIREAYIANAQREGGSLEEAEKQCQREYIAIIEHYHKTTRGMAYDPERSFMYDKTQPTYRWTDLSPQATQDYEHEYERLNTIRKQGIGLTPILERWGLRLYTSDKAKVQAREIIEQLRERRIEDLMAQDDLTREAAIRCANESYISIKTHPNSGRREYRIQPTAIPDIDAAFSEQFPHRPVPEPVGNHQTLVLQDSAFPQRRL